MNSAATERLASCPECRLLIDLSKDDTRHIRHALDEHPHLDVCCICCQQAVSPRDLLRHINHCYPKVSCARCGSRLHRVDDLQAHIDAAHPPPPYQCHHCTAWYFTHKSLWEHQRSSHRDIIGGGYRTRVQKIAIDPERRAAINEGFKQSFIRYAESLRPPLCITGVERTELDRRRKVGQIWKQAQA